VRPVTTSLQFNGIETEQCLLWSAAQKIFYMLKAEQGFGNAAGHHLEPMMDQGVWFGVYAAFQL